MTGRKKKLIIFDIGGVLIDFSEMDYIRYLHRTVLPGIPVRKLEKFIMPLTQLMDYGILNVPQLERMVAKHFGLKKLDLRWVQGYMEVARPIKETIRLCDSLTKRYRVALLSNIPHSRWAEMSMTYLNGLKPEKIFLSYQLHLRKPEPAIYRYVLMETGVKASEAIFIDNQIENVIAAESEGIDSVWFRDHEQLVKELKKFGITLDKQ